MSKSSDEITAVTFMIYGPYSEGDNSLINHALMTFFEGKGYFSQTIETLTMAEAIMFGVCRGECVQWIFEGRLKNPTTIKDLISEGLTFQKIKHEFYGVMQHVHQQTV